MFSEIIQFLMDTVFTVLGTALILRAYMQYLHLPLHQNALSQAIFQLTEWCVAPLRKVFTVLSRRKIQRLSAKPMIYYDWLLSLSAAYLCALIFQLIMGFVLDTSSSLLIPSSLLIAVFLIVRWSLSLLMWIVLLQTILSWFQPHHPLTLLLQTLTAPFLKPLRRLIPPMAGIDFTPIVLLLLIQVFLIVLRNLVGPAVF